MEIFIIIAAIIVIPVIFLIGLYNGLIRLNNRVLEAKSDITVQLKRRFDLIPSLVDTVKGYAKHEKETFTQVIEARNAAMQSMSGAGDMSEIASKNNMLSDTLKSLFALSEAYPDLKANQNFLKLQDEIADTENKIQAARRFYNGNVRDFNTKLQSFPTNIIAGKFGFSDYSFFEVEDQAAVEEVPEINFD